jgi:hypothetical protein
MRIRPGYWNSIPDIHAERERERERERMRENEREREH